MPRQDSPVEAIACASCVSPEDPEIWRNALGRSLIPQGLVTPVIPKYDAFPWVAVTGRQIYAQLETIFDDRYFMASSELNLLNTILLEDNTD